MERTPAARPNNLLTDDTNSPINVCYVEVNNYDMLNVGKYTLSSGGQLFDCAIIFAANISYDPVTRQAGLFFNDRVKYMLDNLDTQIRPLQAKGIKVLLSILGNHQGAGVCNFPDWEAAQAYAQMLAGMVTQYGLDGIDIDDEYADYGKDGSGQPNAWSFPYLISFLRQAMPNGIISWYYIGDATGTQSYEAINVGSYINCSWNAYYGTFDPPQIPQLAPAQLGPAAIAIDQTDVQTAESLAQQTLSGGYGVVMYYNLPDTDSSEYLSNITMVLYNEATVFNG
jgi:hypothetical protein